MGMGIGAAMTGLRPVIEGMNMGFLLLAFNQISNNAGMLHYTSGGQYKTPVVIRGPGALQLLLFVCASAAAPSCLACTTLHAASTRSRGPMPYGPSCSLLCFCCFFLFPCLLKDVFCCGLI